MKQAFLGILLLAGAPVSAQPARHPAAPVYAATTAVPKTASAPLAALFEAYWNEQARLFPLAAPAQGDLNAFFAYMRTDPKFQPFKTPEEVLAVYRSVLTRISPNLPKLFGKTPKTGFEVRETEKFREASASAQYNQGAPDGSRPGIFYVPIPDATQYNVTRGMDALFLHEAIPGHHYQIALQQENTTLPKFRQFGGMVPTWKGGASTPSRWVKSWACTPTLTSR